MKIKPNAHFSSTTEITLDYLYSNNIRAVILDIDNTIVTDGGFNISENVKNWINSRNLPLFFLSNGNEKRVKHFADIFNIGYISNAKKPSLKNYKKAAETLGISDLSEIAVIGDQLFSDILGGNLAGCHTIKVPPIDPKSDPLLVKIKRIFERLF
ncbi:MAG: YqeG family HAD IIIA-type phosphatase [Oscillospiraceae bacterium]|jgi:HAD superfamily phosphatase (TIGR01668 family)|nr:YqeG family HAD IIIA-type phosphatase [Oscillospiraceae bacterium]